MASKSLTDALGGRLGLIVSYAIVLVICLPWGDFVPNQVAYRLVLGLLWAGSFIAFGTYARRRMRLWALPQLPLVMFATWAVYSHLKYCGADMISCG